MMRILIFLFSFEFLFAQSLLEQFQQNGHLEIVNPIHSEESFNTLYAHFDAFIEFLQKNPLLSQKLFMAKERFIRTKERNNYSTDFFGLFDESEKKGRNQISFYYSSHLHEFICSHYKELIHIPEIDIFFQSCFEIQKPFGKLFKEIATDLKLDLFSSEAPVLLKIVKYLPAYIVTKPHYDGTAFSLFLNSTNLQSLHISPYKSSFAIADFFIPQRTFPQSIILIPGAFLTEYSIFPTPHIALPTNAIRYATIAFAMRSNYIYKKVELSPLPSF